MVGFNESQNRVCRFVDSFQQQHNEDKLHQGHHVYVYNQNQGERIGLKLIAFNHQTDEITFFFLGAKLYHKTINLLHWQFPRFIQNRVRRE